MIAATGPALWRDTQGIRTAIGPMMTRSRFRMRTALAVSAALVAASPAAAGPISVDASYSATLSGWTIGSGTLAFTLDDRNNYNADINAGVAGIAALVASRSAVGASTGRAEPSASVPRSYLLSVSGGSVTNTVEMTFAGAAVKTLSATALRFVSNNERVPLRPQHKQNIVDPIGSFVISVPRGRDPLAKETCNRTVRVFDGRVRYDLRLVYGATSEVRDVPGYSGPALICAVAYRPIAGQRILSREQQEFEKNLEFSIWFIPLGDSGVLIPHRVVIGTPMGLLTVAATKFAISGDTARVATPRPRRAKAGEAVNAEE
jgi:hypothetical protein